MDVSIAVVDDDVRILDALELILELHGWRVRTYTSGETFLADLNHHNPDCVLLDPYLPGISSLDVMLSIGNDERLLPVIGLTAKPESRLTLALMDAGVRVMLTKPVTEQELICRIQTVLDGDSEQRPGL